MVKGAITNVHYFPVLKKQKANFKALKESVKQLYFLSSSDVESKSLSEISKCENCNQSLLWKNYMSHIKRQHRNIVLLLDHGGSLSKWQLQIVKAVAKQMIAVLNSKDRIGLLAISDDWSAPYLTEQCLTPNQVPPSTDLYKITQATQHNKYLLNKFVDSLEKGSGKCKLIFLQDYNVPIPSL